MRATVDFAASTSISSVVCAAQEAGSTAMAIAGVLSKMFLVACLSMMVTTSTSRRESCHGPAEASPRRMRTQTKGREGTEDQVRRRGCRARLGRTKAGEEGKAEQGDAGNKIQRV